MDDKALADDHFLKPLETRLLEMCEDTHPAARVLMGNAVAALRVFANAHPGGIHCHCLYHCENCGRGMPIAFAAGDDRSDAWEWWHGPDETVVFCPECKGDQ